jgi:hypothetical protein
VYLKISDHVEVGDYIIHHIDDEYGNDLPVILKLTDTLGTFGRSLIWRKYLASPYTDILPDALKQMVVSGEFTPTS